jgi:hypothetical protein
MSQDHHPVSVIFSVEKVMVENIININDIVIDKFADCKEGRMHFLYK